MRNRPAFIQREAELRAKMIRRAVTITVERVVATHDPNLPEKIVKQIVDLCCSLYPCRPTDEMIVSMIYSYHVDRMA